MIDGENRLKLFVNRIDYGIAAVNLPTDCYGIIDLYGQCEQVNIQSNLFYSFRGGSNYLKFKTIRSKTCVLDL